MKDNYCILTAIIIMALSKKPNPRNGIAVWYAAVEKPNMDYI